GGGVYNLGSLIITNSTLAHNGADDDGGGVFNTSVGVANVYNSSILFNASDADLDSTYGGSGGGIFASPGGTGSFSLRNTLVAGNNLSFSPVSDECYGVLQSWSRNIIGTDADPANCTVYDDTGFDDTLESLDTLGPLQNNGGPTWTHALLPDSNAISYGIGCVDFNGTELDTDQRGFPRIGGFNCDIGAFEYFPLGPFIPL